jgi:citrate lyase synthetase
MKFNEWKNDLVIFQITEAAGKDKTAVAVFGRMNPPTNGHLLLMRKLSELASKESGDAFVFVSHSQDAKKNPLDYNKKVSYIEKMQGKPSNVKLMKEPSVTNVFKMLDFLAKKGYTKIIIVGGSDRAAEYQRLSSYSDRLGAKISFASSGDRDADSDGDAGISASLARKYAKDGKLEDFMKIVPFTKTIATQLFKDITIVIKDVVMPY